MAPARKCRRGDVLPYYIPARAPAQDGFDGIRAREFFMLKPPHFVA
jgi:hypothetical protein